MITDEKRAFKRVDRKFTVKHKKYGDNKNAGGASSSENISLGGVYFVSLKEYHIGETIECRIPIPDTNQEGKWKAKVVRVEPINSGVVSTFGTAIEFINAYGDSDKYLKNSLERSCKKK